MGLAASVGKDNDELIDNLVSNDSLKTERIEKIMRLVDRGKFLPETERENAYKDSAWKSPSGDPGFLHMSAPCIYASVLENLDLGAGMSFLNIGSGTGYLSAMVGFIIGEKGISHGVELYQNVSEFANDQIAAIQQSGEASAFDWCTPTYETGNAFQIETQMKYDRIYCGALVPDSHRSYFCSFLKVDGVLILPYGHVLQRIIRKSENEFQTRDISTVTFSHLIPVNPENSLTNRPIKLPSFEPNPLRLICRDVHYIRARVQQTHKMEMRILCVELPEEERTRNGRDVMELDWVTRRIQEQPNRRLFGRRRRFQTIHFFEEDNDDEDRAEPEDDHQHRHILPNFHQNPMQHFLALVARERLNQHHAARARQEADGNFRHQQRGQIRVYIGNQNLNSAQPPQKNEDNNYGFRFVSENNLNIDDNPQVHDVLGIRTEHDEADEDEDDDNEENNSEEGEENEQMRNTTGQEEDSETNDNLGTNSIDDDSQDKLEVGNEKEGEKVENETSSKGASASNEQSKKMHQSSSSEALASQSANADNSEMVKSGGEKGTRVSMKRQRTPTRSHSMDNSPRQKRVFSRQNADKPSTSNTSSQSAQPTNSRIESVNNKHDENEHKGSVSDNQMASENCGFATEDDDDSSAFSVGQKHANSSCLSAERQADYLRDFHAEFTRLLDTLPLNAQMRHFLKFEVN